jgi:hypothetical protein
MNYFSLSLIYTGIVFNTIEYSKITFEERKEKEKKSYFYSQENDTQSSVVTQMTIVELLLKFIRSLSNL